MAGSSGSSLMTGLVLAGLVLMVALLAIVWRRRRGEAGPEMQDPMQQEQGNLGQELQEMIGDKESCQSTGENWPGLVGRIEVGGAGVEQGSIGEWNLLGMQVEEVEVQEMEVEVDMEVQGCKKVIREDTALI